MKLEIKKAVKHKLKARIALLGPAGSGKTWTALQIAKGLAPSGRYLVIDTERESACLYSDSFSFDVLPLETHSPETYVQALKMAADGGYDVVIVDSLSHAWSGREGALEQVDNKAAKLKGNSYVAWRDVTPMHNALVDALLTSPAHIIATMRVKMAYELVDGRDGKKVPQKIGLQPIQRDGVEYEFTVVADIDTDHTLTVGKTRCAAVDGKTIRKPGPEFGATIRAWLDDGEAAPPKQAQKPADRQPDPETIDGRVEEIRRDLERAKTPDDIDSARAKVKLIARRLTDEHKAVLGAAGEEAEARMFKAPAEMEGAA